jgi:hypothetical protein
MNARELRIGNWVNNNEEDYQITSATILQIERGDAIAHPISLTEEWLVKFEFRCYDNKWDADEIIIMKNGDGYLYLANQLHVNLFYVNQLQNLYFALTGKEL